MKKLPEIVYNWDISLGLDSWGHKVKQVAASLGLPATLLPGEQYDLTNVKPKLLCKSRISWGLEADRKPKLRTFVNIHDYSQYKILISSNLSRFQRSLISQLKLGILPLKIETDRYQGVPENMRYCKLCDTCAVETEFHFLFHCPILSHVRDSLLNEFDIQFDNLPSDSEKLYIMLQKENIRKTGLFLEKLYQARQRIIYK